MYRHHPTTCALFIAGFCVVLATAAARGEINIAQSPLYLGGSAAPLNMLVLGRDHTLYYEAYNDASDLNGDGVLDVGYKPEQIDYFGYFDSFKCYTYSTSQARFNPVAGANGKRCTAVSGGWSGDFLNYLTTARIDALRKVLYGGKRQTDDGPLVVLERSYIPQDAHSWGKEYAGIAHDGYDIRDYAPLALPVAGTRHLFANTTLLQSGNKEPLLRVLVHSSYRIWEWVSIERPVAGGRCQDGSTGPVCVVSGSTTCQIVPNLRLTQTTWKITKTDKSTGNEYPANSSQFDALVGYNAKNANKCGERTVTEINGTGNPFSGTNGCTNEKYLNVFSGEITITEAGTYTFSVNGDDAEDFTIDSSAVASWYGGHGKCTGTDCCTQHTGQRYLNQGVHYIRFRHQEWAGDDSYYLSWRLSTPDSTMTDYVVRNRVCDVATGLAANCRVYPSSNFKPAGLLQRHGEDNRMYFGLISGAYTHPYNMRGGVLRKNMGTLRDEIDPQTGQFTDLVGIIRTIDRMRIVDFNKDQSYQYQGGWLTTAPMADISATSTANRFPDWGNPIAEMLYETVRYFSGKTTPTTEFRPTSATTETITLRDYAGTSSTMTLPLPAWKDPFRDGVAGLATCSAGAMLVISDINPSYDTEYVPGSSFSSFAGDLSGINATAQANAIWQAEHGSVSRQHFIGQVGNTYDGAPTAKTVTGLGNIRGLAPAEPTKQGGYYSASISKYAFETDLRPTIAGTQNLNTVVVALASPLPRIEIPVNGTTVNIVPFAKSVGGSVGGQTISATKGVFQPTNTIVDFYVATFANTDPKGSDADPTVNGGRPLVQFRINFEDVEQGADHDMDAIVLYTVRVNADNTLTVDLSSDYAAGSIIQHLGYVISGTNHDGIYLEVRDRPDGSEADIDYFLDTPAVVWAGGCTSNPSTCNGALPFQTSRTFSTASATATLLNSPLWYAAKYGTRPKNALAEGEASNNYFLVTNAGNLEKQLERAFYEILGLVSSASSAATNSTLLRDDTLVYQARFDSGDWSGDVRAVDVNDDGSQAGTRWSTDDANIFPAHGERRIFSYNGKAGVEFKASAMAAFSVEQCAGLLGVAPATLAGSLLNCNPTAGPGAANRCWCGNLATGFNLTLAVDRLNWLRGDTSKVVAQSFRARRRLLGDIVNSDPFLVDIKDYNYQGLAAVGPETGYDAFLDQLRTAARPPVLYVGSNDGMLHGFNGNTGAEVFNFIPAAAFAGIADLTKPQYNHRFYVDGSPRAVDAFIKVAPAQFAWRTVLVGATGGGGRSVFALDVTDPLHFAANNVLWEFTDPELGVTIARPTIVRLASGWVAIIANGYNSTSARAQLLIVDLASGALLRRIDTGSGDGTHPNGLASPSPVDVNADRIADYVYAGDLLGHLWRFDLTSVNPLDWGLSFAGQPLFTATDAAGRAQPITSRPAVAGHPNGGQMLLFGTGKYFSDDDNIITLDEQIQTFYGIRDDGAAVGPRAVSLTAQSILYQGRSNDRRIRDNIRVITNNANNYAVKAGWYIDLAWSGQRSGERVVDGSVMRTDRVVFTTLIPSNDQCSAGGSSWLMELDYLTGGRLPYSVFDLNDDEGFNLADFIELQQPSASDPKVTETVRLSASAIFIPAIAKIPAFVTAEGKDVKYSSLSSGVLLDVDNAPGPGGGRQSWRQLR